MFEDVSSPQLSFRGTAGTCRTRTRNLGMGVSSQCKTLWDSGFALQRLRRFRAPRNDESGRKPHTPILSIKRVLPILAATSSRTGPSFIELTGASDSAWRASK